MRDGEQPSDRNRTKAYLVGSGIAALASAAYLIRDGGLAGKNIQIFEEASIMGGSLDGAGSPGDGYVLRGGRMFTYEAYTCTLDLLSFVPFLADPRTSVRDEIYAFNEQFASQSRSRLVAGGQKLDASKLGLTYKDRWDLIQIMATSESSLGTRRIKRATLLKRRW